MAQRVGRALVFQDHGTRRGRVVSVTPWPLFTPRKDTVPIVQEAGWAPGPVWTGGKSRPTGIRCPDRPARSQSLYRLSYPVHPDHITVTNYHSTSSEWGGLAESVQRLRLDCPRNESRWGRRFPRPSWGPPSLIYNGYRVIPGVKWSEGGVTTHRHLALRLNKQ